MAFWNRKKPYDRTRILEAAEKARSRGRARKAIAEYRKILAVDPSDAQVNARIAPLLAREGEPEAAARAFEAGAQSFLMKGFVDKAIAVYAQAAAVFPWDERLWTRIAELNFDRGRKADAANALLKGAQYMARHTKHRPRAVALLQRALRVDPTHLQATLLMADVLAKDGRKQQALKGLEALAAKSAGPALRQIRRAQFFISPTPAALWRWIKSGRGRSAPKLPSSASPQ